MANLTDWYLVEIDRLLRRRVPAKQREAMVAEIEDHVRAGAQDETPEQIVARMGSPKQLALIMLNSSSADEPRWVRVLASICLFLLPVGLWVAMLNAHTLSLQPIFAMMTGMGIVAGLCILRFTKLRLSAALLAPTLGFVVAGFCLAATCYDMGDLDGYGLMIKAEIPNTVANLETNSKWLETTKQRIKEQAEGQFEKGPPFDVIVNVWRMSNGEIVPETKNASTLAAAGHLVRASSSNLRLALGNIEANYGSTAQFLADIKQAERHPAWLHGASIVFWSLWHVPGMLFSAVGVNLVGWFLRNVWRRGLLPRRRYAQ